MKLLFLIAYYLTSDFLLANDHVLAFRIDLENLSTRTRQMPLRCQRKLVDSKLEKLFYQLRLEDESTEQYSYFVFLDELEKDISHGTFVSADSTQIQVVQKLGQTIYKHQYIDYFIHELELKVTAEGFKALKYQKKGPQGDPIFSLKCI